MITAVLIGQEHLIPFLREIYPKTQAALEESVGRLSLKLIRHIRQQKLSGQALKHRRGKLKDSINARTVTTGTSITASVGTNTNYAAVHEYGFTGTVSVKEHMRLIKQAYGHAIKPVKVRVREHPMKMNMPERSFLRSSLRDMETEIKTTLAGALKKATK